MTGTRRGFRHPFHHVSTLPLPVPNFALLDSFITLGAWCLAFLDRIPDEATGRVGDDEEHACSGRER